MIPESENFSKGRRALTNNFLDGANYVFKYSRSINDLVRIGEEYSEQLLSEGDPFFTRNWGDKEYSESFIGGPRSEADKMPFSSDYIEEEELTNSIQAFNEILAEVDMGGAFKKAKLIATEKPTGIFDFGLASPGLYRKQEFFSKELKKDEPFLFADELPGIVPGLYVEKNAMGQFWYAMKNGKKYEMTKQQKGTEALKIKAPDAKLEYATSVKKVYVTFKREGGKANFVDLYVGVGGLGGMQSSGMLARALPVMLAARYFESMGIRTRINASRMYHNQGNIFNFCWTIKDFGADLDFKRIAVDTADTRWFRWNLWRYSSAIAIKEYDVANRGSGTTIYGGSYMASCRGRWRNWYFDQMKENKVPFVNLKPELMIFGGLENPPSEYRYEGPEGTVYKQIKEEFLKILDSVDFSFNKPQDAVRRIHQRMVVENGVSMDRFQDYVSNLLKRSYQFPTRGMYATPENEQVKMIDNYITRSADFGKYLQQLQ